MAYMSYIRFEGCLDELESCINDLERGKSLGESETRCKDALVDACHRYIKAVENYTPREDDIDDWEG